MPSRSVRVTTQPPRRAADKKPKDREPPLCPKCGAPMVWFNTELRRDGRSRLVHEFFCKACSETAYVEEPWQGRLRLLPRPN